MKERLNLELNQKKDGNWIAVVIVDDDEIQVVGPSARDTLDRAYNNGLQMMFDD